MGGCGGRCGGGWRWRAVGACLVHMMTLIILNLTCGFIILIIPLAFSKRLHTLLFLSIWIIIISKFYKVKYASRLSNPTWFNLTYECVNKYKVCGSKNSLEKRVNKYKVCSSKNSFSFLRRMYTNKDSPCFTYKSKNI